MIRVYSTFAASQFPGYFAQTYPGTIMGKFSCSICHTSPPGVQELIVELEGLDFMLEPGIYVVTMGFHPQAVRERLILAG